MTLINLLKYKWRHPHIYHKHTTTKACMAWFSISQLSTIMSWTKHRWLWRKKRTKGAYVRSTKETTAKVQQPKPWFIVKKENTGLSAENRDRVQQPQSQQGHRTWKAVLFTETERYNSTTRNRQQCTANGQGRLEDRVFLYGKVVLPALSVISLLQP